MSDVYDGLPGIKPTLPVLINTIRSARQHIDELRLEFAGLFAVMEDAQGECDAEHLWFTIQAMNLTLHRAHWDLSVIRLDAPEAASPDGAQ